MEQVQKLESAEVEETRAELHAFLADNPEATIGISESEPKLPVVQTPWGDPSVAILIPTEEDERASLLEALNGVLLPPRLSALYHKDAERLEVIFTARKLSDGLKELSDRGFEFYFRERLMKCFFGESSGTLLQIARNTIYPQNSTTGFRNLMSFSAFASLPTGDTESTKVARSQFDKPLSFYVDGLQWEEEAVISALRHISFYLRYFDSMSPYVVIHPPEDSTSVNPKERYLLGQFPERITSRELNATLLSFWIAAADAGTENKFLHCYRIIEFVSSNYLKNEKLLQVKRILSDPALTSNLDTSIDTLVSLIREDGRNEVNRFKAVVTELVRKEVIWPEICANPQAFTRDVVFDGGFELRKLVDDVDSIARLGPTVMQSMAGTFRDIRNALAHGGEVQAGKVILPTAKNSKLLQPWAHLIVAVAGEVVLHENHT
jgi:hypothetical protein